MNRHEGRGSEGERPLRLFIAVPAPPAVVQAAERVIAGLRGRGDVRWVRAEQMHLTLKFLGATPPEKVPQIQASLAEIANNFSRFMVECGCPGAFPNPRKPQTLWLGIEGASAGELGRLARTIDEAVGPLGFERERRAFRAHLTLGRVKSPRGLGELVRALEQQAGSEERVPWPVEELHLIRSVLRPAGPEYTPLSHYSLRAED